MKSGPGECLSQGNSRKVEALRESRSRKKGPRSQRKGCFLWGLGGLGPGKPLVLDWEEILLAEKELRIFALDFRDERYYRAEIKTLAERHLQG